MSGRFGTIVSGILVTLVFACPIFAQEQSATGYNTLVALYNEVRADATPPMVDGCRTIAPRQSLYGRQRSRIFDAVWPQFPCPPGRSRSAWTIWSCRHG